MTHSVDVSLSHPQSNPWKKKKITVFQAHVVPTRLVETLVPDQFVSVSKAILVNPPIANLSALKTLIVLWTKLVSIKSAKILALEFVELTHCVKWLVITLYVLVHLDITVILSTIARKFQVRACYFLLYIDLVFLYYVINLEIVCECCNLHYIGIWTQY